MPKPTAKQGVLALDIGTSSVRAAVYDDDGRLLPSTLVDVPYKVRTTAPGEVSSDPKDLVTLIAQSVDGALHAARKSKVDVLAVGASCYWHSLMGVDGSGRPTTELLTWADTRSSAETRRLRARFDERAYHARTGCFFHASYWPSKLRWLRATRPAAVRRTVRWISLGEYLYQQLFGESPVSYSMASGTGLFDVNRCRWDGKALQLAGIEPTNLSRLSDWDNPLHTLRPAFARRWSELREIPWYLPVGDGALANIGAGASSPRWVCATVGTSGAMRVVLERDRVSVPWGTFVYRLDRHRFVLGGALSEGGNVVRWFTDGLGLPNKKALKQAAAEIAPDSHGLTILPFWAGERSPNWRGEARAVIAGLSLGTHPAQLLRAAMEAITFQLVTVASAIQRVVNRPTGVIATGGQLIHSPAWTQMLADALNQRVMTSPEPEASSRGAALLVLHALGKLPRLWSTTPAPGRVFKPRARVHAIYERARRRQEELYDRLIPSTAAVGSGSRRKHPRSPAAKH
ncbi:MAG TPA: gluconokinase [Candidatus Acidoferrum sp.]|nr:gluconokinase [Candidatus Acidoferrum sp.]